jgi:DNA polymerase
MLNVHLDFETRSELSVKDVGGWVYSTHPSTEPICLAYQVNNLPIVSWELGTFQYYRAMGGIELEELYRLAADPTVIFVAHNAFFEQCIWANIMVPKYGMPPIPIRRWRCTAAKAASYGLPRSLEGVGTALNLPIQKDKEGNKTMLKCSRPRKPTKNNPNRWNEDPADLKRTYAYNIQDVQTEKLVDDALRDLNAFEQELWFLDQEINFRGIQLDIAAVRKMLELIEQTTTELGAEFRRVTNGAVDSPSQVVKYRQWLADNGLLLENLQAPTVDAAIKVLPPGAVRRSLEIRRQLSKISTAKYEGMIERSDMRDQRLRECFLYGAAHTGRWGGRGVQVHNLPRGTTDSDIAVRVAMGSDYDWFKEVYPDPMEAYSSSLRGMLIAGRGKDLIVADYASIEARVLAWIADQQSTLDIFRRDEDVYCYEACGIYGRTITKKDKYERSVGKVSVLALGYQGGIGAFGTMARAYSVDLRPAFELLWPTASTQEREKATRAYGGYMGRCKQNGELDPLDRESAIAADIIKQRWREANPKVVSLWYALEAGAIKAVLTGEKVQVGKVTFGVAGDFLLCKLPSGRCICYHRPKVSEKETPWGEKKLSLSFMTENSKFQYTREFTYGGKLCENIVQSVARDILADALLRCENSGYPVVLHVHDEAAAEVPEGTRSVEEFEAILADSPAWADGLPIKAEGWRGKRYKK